MKQLLFFTALIVFSVDSRGQITRENVDLIVKKAVDSVHMAGATVLVAKGDQVIHHKGYGYAQLEFKVPATTETRYYSTGPETLLLAALAMKFMEEKKISLDDRVRKHLPGLPAAYDSVLVKHLLNSTSGIPDYHYIGDKYEATITQPHAYDEVMARIKEMPLLIRPGSRFDWSISNFMILTKVLEEVSGKSYRELVRELLMPLKVSSTDVLEFNSSVEKLAPGYKYALENKRLYPAIESVYNYDPSMRVYTTTGDMFRVWRAMKNGQLISKDSYSLMTSKEEAKKNNSLPSGYLLFLSSFKNIDIVTSYGALPGYSSSFKYIPSEDLTLIVMSNTGVIQEAEQIAYKIASSVTKAPSYPFVVDVSKVADDLPVDKDSMAMFSGTYKAKRTIPGGSGHTSWNVYERTFRVFTEYGRLMFQYLGEAPTRLKKQKDGSYHVEGSVPFSRLQFIVEEGKVNKVVKRYDFLPDVDNAQRVDGL